MPRYSWDFLICTNSSCPFAQSQNSVAGFFLRSALDKKFVSSLPLYVMENHRFVLSESHAMLSEDVDNSLDGPESLFSSPGDR